MSQMANTLIPFWDMANHDNGELSTDFDDEKDCTLCMAHKDFEMGQQFTIFYGVRANIDLLGTIHILRTHFYGSFTNYVYKKRWVGSPKMSTFIR